MHTIQSLFDLSHTLAGAYLQQFTHPWEAVRGIGDFVVHLGPALGGEYRETAPGVWIHESAVIAPTACILGPSIIGPETEVRHGAFIRGCVLVGRGCVVGNSAELKNAILFDEVQVNHFNYVGDSILGWRAHLGAGAVTSNVRQDKAAICIPADEGRIETGLEKLGAMLGDNVEVGCNSVLNPGIIAGRNASIYPLSCVRRCIPENCIHKNSGEIVPRR